MATAAIRSTNFIKRFTPCLIFFALLVIGNGLVGQQTQFIFEEIETIPKDKKGQWVIGGETYTVDQQTMLIDEDPAEEGRIAYVEYETQDGSKKATLIRPFEFEAAEINDGPYVFWKDETTAEVVTVAAGKVKRKTIANITQPQFEEGLSKLETRVLLDPRVPKPTQAEWETPSKLLAISDLEGHYENVIQFLQTHQIIDENRQWAWGDGHLALVGDLVDRGSQVTELMVFLRRLEHEAEKAGGRIHYVLGNHEVMVMGSDIRYIHVKYHFIAQRIGMDYSELFGATSDIGRWWRSKNIITRVGNLLFVHAGYSPELNAAQLDPEKINDLARKSLPPIPETDSMGSKIIGSSSGPLWYRGYFEKHAGQWTRPSDEEMDSLIARHQVDHIVIGHTVVDDAGPLPDTKHVIGIDVKWSKARKCQGLLQQEGKLWRLTMDGKRERIEIEE